MLGICAACASRLILSTPQVAQDLRADAVGAQVHAALAPARSRGAGAASAAPCALSPQLSSTATPVPARCDACERGIEAPRMRRARRRRAGRAPTAARARAPAFRSGCQLAAHQRQVRRVAGLVAVDDAARNAPRRCAISRSPTRSTSDSLRLRCSIRAAMVPILRPCSARNRCRSGRRAIVPSSFMISQITAAGVQAGQAARSQPASVWPARISTPPSLRLQREDVAGLHQVGGPARRARRRLHGARAVGGGDAGGDASAASIDTVNAVPCSGRCARPSAAVAGARACSRVSVRQIRPRRAWP